MKKFIALSTIPVFALVALFAQTTAQSADIVKWDKTSHDFGTVKMGPPAEVTFTFTNSGKAPVTILTAQPSCGCTTPTFTSTPVMPGKTGTVKASYGTDNRPGFFQKTVTVNFDNGSNQILTISGTVNTDPGASGGQIK